MAITVITLLFLAIALLEVPKLVRQQYWRELVVFSILLGIGFTLSVLLAAGVEIPPVTETITRIVLSALNRQN